MIFLQLLLGMVVSVIIFKALRKIIISARERKELNKLFIES